MSEHNIKTN